MPYPLFILQTLFCLKNKISIEMLSSIEGAKPMRQSKRILNNVLTYIGFAGPAVFVFLTVIILPFLFGIYLTFTNWDGISNFPSLVGMANYREVLGDQQFWGSVWLTLKYVFFSVIITNVIAFILAYLLTSGIKAQAFFRTVFFTPYLIGGIILGYLWNFLIFQRVLIFIGQKFNIPLFMTSWLGDPDRAFWALVIGFTWQYIGYMMMIFIAGFISIPHELLEAASIDGANGYNRLKHITLPLMVAPIIICTVLSVQRGFMVYDVNLALTKGGPFNSTELISMHVYNTAFTYQKYGIGQAEAFFLFFMVVIIALVQVYFSKKLEVEA